ncbi:MAG: exonuclease domain-containing protein [Polyangiaceae bacterium]
MSGAKVPLASRRLLFVDVETTGLDPVRHEIIELAAVRVHPQLLFIERELVTRVRPQFPERCSMETASINGFDPQKWDHEPDIYDALKRFAPLAEGCILAGHNVGFDKAFLAAGYRRAGLEEPKMDHHTIDTATLAWPLAVAGALESLSLGPVCDLLGIRNEGAHSARRDVARAMEVYRRLMALRMPVPPGAPPPMEGDEDAILATQAARLAEGQHTYGTWRVGDGRNNAGEALLEVMDALNYCAAELVRLARAKGEES